jgi:hypothetical protein
MTAAPGNSRRITLLALLLIAVLFAIYRLRGFTQRPGAIAPVAVPVTPSPIAAPNADHRTAEARASAAVAPSAAHPTLRDRSVRDDIREKIYRGFGRPLPAASTATKAALAPFGPDAGTLDRVYIQKRIREDFVPLAKECYEAALERDGKLQGKLVFSFVIAGNDDVGGIVESAELDPSSTLVEKELVYCLRESLLSLSFEPPEQGGVVTVTYPFVFSPDGPGPDSRPR